MVLLEQSVHKFNFFTLKYFDNKHFVMGLVQLGATFVSSIDRNELRFGQGILNKQIQHVVKI